MVLLEWSFGVIISCYCDLIMFLVFLKGYYVVVKYLFEVFIN